MCQTADSSTRTLHRRSVNSLPHCCTSLVIYALSVRLHRTTHYISELCVALGHLLVHTGDATNKPRGGASTPTACSSHLSAYPHFEMWGTGRAVKGREGMRSGQGTLPLPRKCNKGQRQNIKSVPIRRTALIIRLGGRMRSVTALVIHSASTVHGTRSQDHKYTKGTQMQAMRLLADV